MRFGALARLVALVAPCVALAMASAPADAIVGGYTPDPTQWPWLVSIEISPAAAPSADARARHRCGGTLINPTVVLTAAHCVYDDHGRRLVAAQLSVVLGRQDLRSADGVESAVRTTRVYPGYGRRRGAADMALLFLAQPTTLTPAAILSPTVALYSGQTARVMGWGATSDDARALADGTAYPSARLAVDVPLRRISACRRFQERAAPFDPDTMICAGSPVGGHDACYGDSGGPLMMLRGGVWKLVGIVSSGRGCGRPNHPGYYASPSSPRPYRWILDTTQRTLDRADGA